MNKIGYRVVFNKPFEASYEEYKVRECKENEVKIKVQYSLISNGTERQHYRGLRDNYPFIPGYSSVGYVCELGKGINEDVITYGDRVFVIKGGHQSYNIKSLNYIVKIPNEVDLEEAVFARAASFPLTGLRRACVQPGENIVVTGLGLLGLFGVQISSLLAPFSLVAIGNRDDRRELAKNYGAEKSFDPKLPNFEKIVTSYLENKTGRRGADVVLETSGNLDAIASAVKYTNIRGRIIMGGMSNQITNNISMFNLFNKGINLVGGSSSSRLQYNSYFNNFTEKDDLKFIMNLIKKKKIYFEGINPSFKDPEQASEIYKDLDTNYQFPLACIFDWSSK